MTPRPKDADQLAAWAAERAPRLVVQAEAEAVAVLRDAMVNAAVTARIQPPQVAPSEPVETEAAPAGDLLWTYCVLRVEDPYPQDLSGVHESGSVERVQAGSLAALVSRVPKAVFAEEPLRRHLNDLPWLERTARAHEAVLEQTLSSSTIVPLRMCTLFETGDSVRAMLEGQRDTFEAALEALTGRQEWGVKVLIDTSRLLEQARARSDQVPALEEELRDRGAGGAYMVRRRLERHVRDLADTLASEIAEQAHARLQDWAIDAVTRPAQNRDLSGHEGEMLLNAAYLVQADRIAELRQLVSELETHYGDLGARIELTGPWPPYNFLPDGAALP